MRVLINKEQPYIPEWNGNRNLPEAEQAIVYYRYMTGPEREKIYNIDLKFDSEGNPEKNFNINLERSKMIKTCIIRTEHLLLFDKDGKERDATAEDICSCSELSGLYRELSTFLQSENTNIDKKKLK